MQSRNQACWKINNGFGKIETQQKEKIARKKKYQNNMAKVKKNNRKQNKTYLHL